VISLVHHSDHGEDEDAVDLFTADGTWVRGGKPFTGRDQLLQSFAARSKSVVTRHFTSNIRIVVTDDNNAGGVTYFMAVNHDAGTDDPELPLPVNLPFSIGEYHDKFVRTQAGWRISHRMITRVFQRGV
jgi:hypothetical protein